MKFENDLVSDIYTKVRSSVSEVPGSLTGISELVLNISEGCNLTCGYCFANKGLYSAGSSVWMSREDAYQYTRKMLELQPGIRRIKLFGGEPFMNIPAMTGFADAFEGHIEDNPDLREVMSVGCVTNLTIYSHKIVEIIKRADIKITASIDGPKRIHDKNRRFQNGYGSFDRIISVAEKYAGSGIRIDGVECVYGPAHQNAGISMIDLHEFILSILNPRRVILTPLQAALPDNMPEQIIFSEWIRQTSSEYLSECVRRKKEHPSYRAVVDDQLRVLFDSRSSLGWCELGFSTCTITADGAVVPCYTLLNNKEEWIMGRVDHKSFIPSGRVQEILHTLERAAPMLYEECKGCDIREVCSGCPGAVYSQRKVLTGYDSVSCNYRIGSLEGLIEGWENVATG